jgi:hypothetical protein
MVTQLKVTLLASNCTGGTAMSSGQVFNPPIPQFPKAYVQKQTLQAGAYTVTFHEDSRQPNLFHYVISDNKDQIMMWGQETCLEDAERCANEWVQQFLKASYAS